MFGKIKYMDTNGIRDIMKRVEQVKRNLFKNKDNPKAVEIAMMEFDVLLQELDDYDKGRILTE